MTAFLYVKLDEMENFNTITHKKFQNTANYQFIENGIYNDLNDVDGFSTYRTAIAIEFEKEKNTQQIIEERLESYFVHIEELIITHNSNVQKYILGGELEDIQKFLSLINITR